MTQQEIGTELNSLRELLSQQRQKEEARKKNWASIRWSASPAAIVFTVTAAGLVGVSSTLAFTSPSGHGGTSFLPLATTLIFVSMPLNLLRQALVDPVSSP